MDRTRSNEERSCWSGLIKIIYALSTRIYTSIPAHLSSYEGLLCSYTMVVGANRYVGPHPAAITEYTFVWHQIYPASYS